jgi:hypothetical protein
MLEILNHLPCAQHCLAEGKLSLFQFSILVRFNSIEQYRGSLALDWESDISAFPLAYSG